MKSPHLRLICSTILILGSAGCTANGALNASLPAGVTSTADGTSNSPGHAGAKQVSSIRVSPDNLVVTVGNAKELTGSVHYSDGTIDSSVNWSSSDDTIVSVNPTTGKLTGVKPGVTTIVASSIMDPSKTATVTVTIRSAEVVDAVTRVEPSEAAIMVGKTSRLNAQIQMSDGSISPNVVWSSDDESIAIVSNGLVTAIAPGETTIWATAAGDSTKKASAKVVVTSEEE